MVIQTQTNKCEVSIPPTPWNNMISGVLVQSRIFENTSYGP